MKFTVDRAKWRCGIDGATGHGKGSTRLRNDHNHCCCLGFVSEQCGVPANITAGRYFPEELPGEWLPRVAILASDNLIATELGHDAAMINDRASISRPEREALLTALFSKHGHELEFVGRYTDEPEEVSPATSQRLSFVDVCVSQALAK